jgi:hypothetical protein
VFTACGRADCMDRELARRASPRPLPPGQRSAPAARCRNPPSQDAPLASACCIQTVPAQLRRPAAGALPTGWTIGPLSTTARSPRRPRRPETALRRIRHPPSLLSWLDPAALKSAKTACFTLNVMLLENGLILGYEYAQQAGECVDDLGACARRAASSQASTHSGPLRRKQSSNKVSSDLAGGAPASSRDWPRPPPRPRSLHRPPPRSSRQPARQADTPTTCSIARPTGPNRARCITERRSWGRRAGGAQVFSARRAHGPRHAWAGADGRRATALEVGCC